MTSNQKRSDVSQRQFFLGRHGKIYGPIQPAAFQQMLDNGELATYSWFWDTQSSGWNPVDPMPGLPITSQALETLAQASVAGPSCQKVPEIAPPISATPPVAVMPVRPIFEQLAIPASWLPVLVSEHEIFEGKLLHLTEKTTSFEFCAEQLRDLAVGRVVELNLFDTQSEAGVQLPVRVNRIEQKGTFVRLELAFKDGRLIKDFHNHATRGPHGERTANSGLALNS